MTNFKSKILVVVIMYIYYKLFVESNDEIFI